MTLTQRLTAYRREEEDLRKTFEDIMRVLVLRIPPKVEATGWRFAFARPEGQFIRIGLEDRARLEEWFYLVPASVIDGGLEAVNQWAIKFVDDSDALRKDALRKQKLQQLAEHEKAVEKLRAELGQSGDTHADPRPERCRDRLREEGKAYPRSSCDACSASIRFGLECRYAKGGLV